MLILWGYRQIVVNFHNRKLILEKQREGQRQGPISSLWQLKQLKLEFHPRSFDDNLNYYKKFLNFIINLLIPLSFYNIIKV
jgi:hypothetical protein